MVHWWQKNGEGVILSFQKQKVGLNHSLKMVIVFDRFFQFIENKKWKLKY